MPDINVHKQSINTFIIIAGIGLLLYDFIANPTVVYFKISGLVILMFGLYKSTQQWTKDNKTEEIEEQNTTIEDNTEFDEDVDFDEDNIHQNGK